MSTQYSQTRRGVALTFIVIAILFGAIFAIGSYGLCSIMLEKGYSWWHMVIATSFLWLIYVAIFASHVLTKEGGWFIASAIFLIMFIAGTFWIYNAMAQEGYVWWQWTIAILSEWIIYVVLIARVLPWIIRIMEESSGV